MKIIVIGSIAAGVSAALRLSAGEQQVQITVYEKGGFYSCSSLPQYLAAGQNELKGLIRNAEQALASNGIKAFLRHEVRGIDADAHSVTICDLSTGREFSDHYDKLVAATGSDCFIPHVQGSDRMGVHTLKSVEDLIFLKEYLRTPYVRDIIVLGGNLAGLQIADAVLKLGRNVLVIEESGCLFPQFDPDVSRLIQQRLEQKGVRFLLGEQVAAFPGRTFIEQVQTDCGSYPCDLCLISVEGSPNTVLLQQAGAELASNGAVLVKTDLSTSVPDVYAAGSCACCGDRGLNTRSLQIGSLKAASTGMTEGEAKSTGMQVNSVMASVSDRSGVCSKPSPFTLKLVYDSISHRIIGAQACGEEDVFSEINAIAVAISAGITIEALGQVELAHSAAAGSIWNPIRAVCSKVQA